MVKKNAREEYKEQLEQAKEDTKTVVKTVEQLIDMPMFEFCGFCEGRNIGELKAFRSLMQTNLDQVDSYGNKLLKNKLTSFNQSARETIGSIFSIAAKIQDRMGYMDYLIKKNSI